MPSNMWHLIVKLRVRLGPTHMETLDSAVAQEAFKLFLKNFFISKIY